MNTNKKLTNYLESKGGIASYSEIIDAGFNKIIIKESVRTGNIQKLDRGLYISKNGITLAYPDFVAVSIKVPKGVICLLSALAFYEATSEIPKYVDIAIPQGTHANKIKYPPVKFYRFALNSWKAGIEEHKLEGHKIRVYNLAKTIADCFKFRNKIGIDVAREALKIAVKNKNTDPKNILKYSKICRVNNVVKPILETLF